MEQQAEIAASYGMLIQVKDLTKLKVFYRDTLRLGAPRVDSNFWVEFDLPGAGILVLEQSNAANTSQSKQDVSWMLKVEDLNDMIESLKQINIKPLRPAKSVPGKDCVTFADPEGNLFTLYTANANS